MKASMITHINVRPFAWEAPASAAALYRGIYVVTLNRTVEIRVLPIVDTDAWPPPPSDIDAATDAMTVRRHVLARSGYAVVLDETRAGREQALAQFATTDGPSPDGRCFFMGAAEHATLCDELERLCARTGSLHACTPLGERDAVLGRLLARI